MQKHIREGKRIRVYGKVMGKIKFKFTTFPPESNEKSKLEISVL